MMRDGVWERVCCGGMRDGAVFEANCMVNQRIDGCLDYRKIVCKVKIQPNQLISHLFLQQQDCVPMSQWFAGVFCPRTGRHDHEQESEVREVAERGPVDVDGFGMRSEYWVITNTNYEAMDMQNKFRNTGSLSPRYLTVEDLRRSTILKELQPPKYQQLISLYLSGNLITSIECIQFFQAPKLSILDLRNNLITNVRTLRKCNTTFTLLCLSNNPITELSGLSAVAFHKKMHNSITSSMVAGWIHPLMVYDISQLARAESPKILQMMFMRNETVPWREKAFWVLGTRRYDKKSWGVPGLKRN